MVFDEGEEKNSLDTPPTFFIIETFFLDEESTRSNSIGSAVGGLTIKESK